MPVAITAAADLLLATAALFSNEPAAVPSLVERLQEQSRPPSASASLLGEQLAGHEAAGTARARYRGKRRNARCLAFPPDRLMPQLRAERLSIPATIGLLAGTAGDKVTVIFCRSADLNMHISTLPRYAAASAVVAVARSTHRAAVLRLNSPRLRFDHASGLVLEQKRIDRR
ncbi:MAG: hypothetical protein H6643_00790 [Caldilineaceae bacterium]|nr:hypothetical protein [Caldilineaceae bacterium]